MKKKESKTKENIFFYLLDILSDAACFVIKKVNKLLTDKKTNIIVKSIIRVLCCLLILGLLEIPFFLIFKIGEGVIYLCDMTFGGIATGIWSFGVNYVYIIFALIVFLKTIIDMSGKKEYNFDIKENKKASKNIYEALQIITKVMISISIIPLALLGILLFSILGMLIGFLTHGIFVFGPIIMVIGLLIMLTFLLSYLYDVVFPNKGGDNNE